MHGVCADSELDGAAGRLPDRRRRHRHHQPRHRPGGDRRRAGREVGDGLGDQHDLPPGRDRDRRRRARGDLPVAGRLEARRAAAQRARRASAKSSPRAAPARPRLPLPPGHAPKSSHAADVAFVSGFNEIILIAAVLSFVGAALGFFLVRSRDFVQPTDGAAAATAGRCRERPRGRSAAALLHRERCCASCGSRTCC